MPMVVGDNDYMVMIVAMIVMMIVRGSVKRQNRMAWGAMGAMSEDHDHQPPLFTIIRYIFTPPPDQYWPNIVSSSRFHWAYTSLRPIIYAVLTKHIELLPFYPKPLLCTWSCTPVVKCSCTTTSLLAFCSLLVSPTFYRLPTPMYFPSGEPPMGYLGFCWGAVHI